MWNSADAISRVIEIGQLAALLTIILAGALIAFVIVATQRRDKLNEQAQILRQDSKLRPSTPLRPAVASPKAEYFDFFPTFQNGAVRTITDAQRNRLVHVASQLRSKHAVFITSIPDNPESEAYAEQLRLALVDAGWEVYGASLDDRAACSAAGVDFVVPMNAKRETVVLWKIFQSAGLRWSQIRYERPSVGTGVEIRVGADPFPQPPAPGSSEQRDLALASMLIDDPGENVRDHKLV